MKQPFENFTWFHYWGRKWNYCWNKCKSSDQTIWGSYCLDFPSLWRHTFWFWIMTTNVVKRRKCKMFYFSQSKNRIHWLGSKWFNLEREVQFQKANKSNKIKGNFNCTLGMKGKYFVKHFRHFNHIFIQIFVFHLYLSVEKSPSCCQQCVCSYLCICTGCFFHWYPAKKLKYGKPRLGESTLT